LFNTVLNYGLFVHPFIRASQRDVLPYDCVKSCSVMKIATEPILIFFWKKIYKMQFCILQLLPSFGAFKDMVINLILMDPCIVVWFSRNNQQDATL